MSHHENHCADESAADSWYDAKSILALIAIVITTVCFWLVGQ